jgi:N-methylhydantoinase A
VVTIAAATMADAIREITIEQGEDPRRATLMAFGGAGPLFSTLLARELDVKSILIPQHPGNFSAWGLLGADLTRTAARTRIMNLSEQALGKADGLLEDLFGALRSRVPSDVANAETTEEVAFDMRYAGQEHSITVPVPFEAARVGTSAQELRKSFEARYARAFGHTMEEAAEIVAIRATLRTPLPRRTSTDGTEQQTNREGPDVIDAYSLTEDRWVRFDVRERDLLEKGDEIGGPTILLEPTATTYLDIGFSARVHESGALFITATGNSA